MSEPLIDRLAKLHAATTKGEWEADTCEDKRERTAYERIMVGNQTLFGTENSDLSEIDYADDGESIHYWDETGRKNLAFVEAAHNEFPSLVLQFRDLLAACQSMMKTCGGSEFWNGETHESLKLIEAAIAKATGSAVPS